MTMVRTRWAAIGAAVAVALGAGGFGLGQAAGSADVDPVYVALSAPCRVVDTRSGSPVGAGDANALTVQITGENGECTDDLAIPADAVAVAANVTAIRPTGAPSGRSFFTVYPADASRPNTSNLNFVNDQPPTPNKVDVGLSSEGRIKIYNDQGAAHAAVDVFGYYVDHDHDDRYYTKVQLDTSLGALNAAIGTKANSTNVYTKAEIDEIVTTNVTRISYSGAPTATQGTYLRDLGTFTKQFATSAIRITWISELQSNGTPCRLHLRVNDVTSAGTASGFPGVGAYVVAGSTPFTVVDVFTGLGAGQHSLKIFVPEATGTDCFENPGGPTRSVLIEEVPS